MMPGKRAFTSQKYVWLGTTTACDHHQLIVRISQLRASATAQAQNLQRCVPTAHAARAAAIKLVPITLTADGCKICSDPKGAQFEPFVRAQITAPSARAARARTAAALRARGTRGARSIELPGVKQRAMYQRHRPARLSGAIQST